MAEDSDLEKNEPPTSHKLEKAREKGQIPRSRELTSMLMLAAGLGILWVAGGNMASQLMLAFSQGFHFNHDIVSNDRQIIKMLVLLMRTASALLPLFAGLVLVALVVPMFLGGVLFAPKFEFDLSRLDPFSGLKRMFSGKLLAELLKSLLKVLTVGIVTSLFLWIFASEIFRLLYEPLLQALSHAMFLIILCSFLVVLGLTPMVIFDVFYQVTSHTKKLRMTKKEISDEHKEQEGNPLIKSHIRRLQRAFAQKRMMADVPKADVIVTNPSHYAIALQYIDKKMSAPKVLAKGAGEIALRIRELGAKHRIPLLEAPPLARALYRHSEIGQHIPTALYSAVAEVLAWVYQLKRWRREGGIIPKKPEHLPVPEALDFIGESDTHG